MMACGHTANSTRTDLNPPVPACVICSCIEQVEAPDLTGRTMICAYKQGRNGKGHEPRPSDASEAFFEYRPSEPHDRYYCGCWGWD
jgi:hypothetical protein